jgi:antitoxin component YwqK of YwqJK toxin-antitoxin module
MLEKALGYLVLVIALATGGCASLPKESIICPPDAVLKTGASGPTWISAYLDPGTEGAWCEAVAAGGLVPHGPFRTWNSEGAIVTEGQFDRGVRVGEWSIFLRGEDGGDLGYQRIPFEGGVRHGIATTFSSSGDPLFEIPFQEGVIHGTATAWYPIGAKKSEMTYREGVLDGPSRFYFENGRLSADLLYSGGKRQGWSRTWYPSGALRTEGSYDDLNRIGTWRYYDSEGSLTKEEEFEGGGLVRLLFVVEGELTPLTCPESAALVKDETFEEPFDSRISCRLTAADGKSIAHGSFIDWIGDVVLGATGQFAHGERHGTWIFRDGMGEVVSQAEYEHGHLVSGEAPGE